MFIMPIMFLIFAVLINIYGIMQNEFLINVYLNSVTFKAGKVCFCREVYCDPKISVNFDSLISSLRFLFGKDCIIDLQILSL